VAFWPPGNSHSSHLGAFSFLILLREGELKATIIRQVMSDLTLTMEKQSCAESRRLYRSGEIVKIPAWRA
jgi:hypothetical protein